MASQASGGHTESSRSVEWLYERKAAYWLAMAGHQLVDLSGRGVHFAVDRLVAG
jgi:hypothetical protein